MCKQLWPDGFPLLDAWTNGSLLLISKSARFNSHFPGLADSLLIFILNFFFCLPRQTKTSYIQTYHFTESSSDVHSLLFQWPGKSGKRDNTEIKKHYGGCIPLLGPSRSSRAACYRSDVTSTRSQTCWNAGLESCQCQNHRMLPTVTQHSLVLIMHCHHHHIIIWVDGMSRVTIMTTDLPHAQCYAECIRSNHVNSRAYISSYHTIDLYQPWKIARGRADITLATGWYSVSDGRLQTAAHASATDVSDWLLQAARHCLADM